MTAKKRAASAGADATASEDTAEASSTTKKKSAPRKRVATAKKTASPAKKSAADAPAASALKATRSSDPRPSRESVKAEVVSSASADRKQRNFYLSVDVIERLERLVYWSAAGVLEAMKRGEDVDTEMIPDNYSTTVEAALWAEILLNERLYNDGQPFPPKPAGRRAPSGPSQAGAARLSEKAKRRHEQ